MNSFYNFEKNKLSRLSNVDHRIRLLVIIFFIGFFIILFRLFMLMILQHDFYVVLATRSQETYMEIFPRRGEIYVKDTKSGEKFPVALNQDLFLLYADTRKIKDEEEAESVAEKLAEKFFYDDEKKMEIYLQLIKKDDPYEPIQTKVSEEKKKEIQDMELPGIFFLRKPYRFYPENNLAAQVIGFLGKNEDDDEIGRYGAEGYWNKELSGSGGFMEGKKGAKGSWISLSNRLFKLSEDGADLVLTIDRTLQFKACERLREAMKQYEAVSASLVIMDPSTGAVLTMCSLPDFDINNYNKVDSIDVFNNQTVFVAYEPGSIFKPVLMSGAINENIVSPDSTFYDTGSQEDLCQKPIKNAGGKIYGDQTMTGVLENSINTGMVYVAEKMGKKMVVKYIEDFGFGISTGVGLDTEVSGNIESLYKTDWDKISCYEATASFGQGITVTPIQMAVAFSAIANGGKLMKPYIVDEIIYKSGKIEKTKAEEIRQVIDKRTSSLVSGMLVSSVEKGYSDRASVDGYYLAGKTGTAQIAGPGGYTEESIHSFVGFGPVDNPKFVIVIKLEKPKMNYSMYTTTPVFADLAKFILDYYQIPPNKF